MSTGALLLIAHEFILMLCEGPNCTSLTIYPTYKACVSAQAYYLSAGLLTKCERVP